ncbi:hypothetical protein [Neolewinella persica]|uniref:hypothetical protein n=1 Tax=Neolewinella persica TaxID=70998 RepID=UPI00035CE5CE|nr:hypothetical protein [Neolewinella persica]
MRYFSLLVFALLLSCSGNEAPITATTTEPAPAAVPLDRQESGDERIDAIRNEYGRIEDQYEKGMLQQRNVDYHCGELDGSIQLHTENGKIVLALNQYKDGTQQTTTDRWYFQDGQLIFQLSETNTWQLDGPMMQDSNGNMIPGVKNTTAQYRHYVKDGTVFKFLKKKYDHYTHKVDNVNPDTVPMEEMTTNGALPFRFGLAKQAMENGAVDCNFFTSVE